MKQPVLILCLLVSLAGSARAIPGGDPVQASLVSAGNGLAPGRTATLALKLEIAEHWHTYWKNPGDSGFPTSLEWDLPEGYSAG
ncbi:MAG: hypothetical protein GWO24_07280, partial [Akkermansiaceae bacterium]|nr:hypothetical protein [Akkermansiaceae bacterium]